MKTKKIIPLVIVTLMVLGITSISIFSFYAREKNNDLKQTTSTDVSKKENLEKDSKEENEEEPENVEETKTPANDELDTDNSDNQNVDTTPKTNNSNSTSNNSTNNCTSNNNSVPNTNTTPKVTEQPKQLTEWEKLGISEYDYYNSPREGQSDMILDFAVSKYGSSTDAYNACMDAGSNYTGLKDYRFRCYEIYSYSDNILGYHIKYFELQS